MQLISSEKFRQSLSIILAAYRSPIPAVQQFKDLVVDYLYSSVDRARILQELSGLVTVENAAMLVDILRRQLERQWSDGSHHSRELLVVEVLQFLSTSTHKHLIIAASANNAKLLKVLEQHLRNMTAEAHHSALQLSRKILRWFDTVADCDHRLAILQERYDFLLTDSRERLPRALPDNSIRDHELSWSRIYRDLEDANALAFLILRLKLNNDPADYSFLETSLQSATGLIHSLNRISWLEYTFDESDFTARLKGRIVDTIQRLEYCLSLERAEDPSLPPRYHYRRN